MTITSPCVGLCKYDETTGYCLGCARTEDEIAGWGMTSEARRAAVWEALPARFQTLGVACRRLPWTTEDTRGFVAERLRGGAGTWVAGVVAAVAEFSARPAASVEVDVQGDTIVARTPGGALSFRVDHHVRALTFEAGDVRLDRSRIVLAVKRERGRLDMADALTDLGQDVRALDPTARTAHLFDMELGRKEARFCVRLGQGPTETAMRGALGSAFPESLPKIGPALLTESPVRVVETALGRIEVSTPIPPPGGTSPAGPHTHLLPDHLATGRALPAGFDLPRAYLPGAMFYPAK